MTAELSAAVAARNKSLPSIRAGSHRRRCSDLVKSKFGDGGGGEVVSFFTDGGGEKQLEYQ